jgi:hypothetical protein
MWAYHDAVWEYAGALAAAVRAFTHPDIMGGCDGVTGLADGCETCAALAAAAALLPDE